MITKKLAIALALGSSILCTRVSLAAEGAKAKTDAPAKADSTEPRTGGDKAVTSTVKLTKPWSELTSLTDEQKSQIDTIHKKALAETSVIEKKAKEDMMAVLTDAQKAELKDLTSKKKKDTAVNKKPAAGEGEKKADENKTEKTDAK